MQQYVIRRIFLNVIVIFLVATMVFLALRIDPDNVVRNRALGCTLQNYEQCRRVARAELGLDKPLMEQYVTFIADTATFDLGESYYTKESVLDSVMDRAGPSIELGLLQIAVALAVALPIGVISAIRQDTWIDYLLRFTALAFLGIPVFVIAVFVILGTSRFAGDTFLPEWFGTHSGSDWVGIFDDPVQNLKIVTGPALIGGLSTGAIIMRFLRSQMLEVLRQDYVRTAWAKGLRERAVVVRHALKNAMIPVLTIVGILLGSIVTGNVILETLYGIPGIGFYLVTSIKQFDYPVVQGTILMIAVSLVFINLVIDVAYGWLDPRIKYS